MADFHALMFRQNLKRRRESSGMTQTELARLMKARGHGFHQQTIQRIEGGERPVRIEEAFDLAEVLGSTVQSMSEWIGEGMYELVYSVDKLGTETRGVRQSLSDAMGDWIMVCEDLASAFTDMQIARTSEDLGKVATAAAWIVKALWVIDTVGELDRMLAGLDVEHHGDWHEAGARFSSTGVEELRWLDDESVDKWRSLPEAERPVFLADLNAYDLAQRFTASFIEDLGAEGVALDGDA